VRIGVPTEIKDGENRVAITPAGVAAFVDRGHQVLVERGAGANCGIGNRDYQQAGARLVTTPERLYADADLILKVKEPLPPEYDLLREGQLLFT